MEVIGEFFGTTTASWSPSGVSRAPTISTGSPPEAAKTGGASPTPPMSTEPEAMACSSGGPEVKSDQLTWNGSVFSRPAADSTASAPVPFWSPTLSVTADRFTTVDADGLAVLAPELPVLDDDDDEQPAAASPASASTVTAWNLALDIMIVPQMISRFPRLGRRVRSAASAAA